LPPSSEDHLYANYIVNIIKKSNTSVTERQANDLTQHNSALHSGKNYSGGEIISRTGLAVLTQFQRMERRKDGPISAINTAMSDKRDST